MATRRRLLPRPRKISTDDLGGACVEICRWFRHNRLANVLFVGICLVLFFDILEGLSPPADADSLAYHFALPKQFLEAGGMAFVPRALEGSPFLVQITYLPALWLGGEIGLTLWVMFVSWMAAFLLFVICRRYLSLEWSLATALIFLTTPAVLYGGGTGQVETKLVLFALGGAWAVSDALRTGKLKYAVLAGLMAGFYAGGKYFGLLFIIACAAPLLRLGWRGTAAYSLAVLVAGAQWYGWNWYHWGDPVFPALYSFLDVADSVFWDQEHNSYFWGVFAPGERSVPVNLFWYFAYPFASAVGAVGVNLVRVGFGPYGLLILPFTAVAFCPVRRGVLLHPLAAPAAIALIFYTLWFFSGASQHIRHLLPVYAILLICMTVAAVRSRHERVLAWITGFVMLIQLGGAGLIGLNYARYVFSDESRNEFLARNVSRFAPVPWINANLTQDDRILLVYAPLTYLIDVPVFPATDVSQVIVDISPRATNAGKFLEQIKAQGISHVLVHFGIEQGRVVGWPLVETLRKNGCLNIIKTFKVHTIPSRTLAAFQEPAKPETGGVMKLRTEGCRI